MRKGLAAHAVLLAGARNFEVIVARKLQRVADVVLTRDVDNSVDCCFIQMAGVVGESAELLERHWGRFRRRKESPRFQLIRISRENEVAFLFLVRRGGVLIESPSAKNEEGSNKQAERKKYGSLATQVHLLLALVVENRRIYYVAPGFAEYYQHLTL
jgi:hypothetical protein